MASEDLPRVNAVNAALPRLADWPERLAELVEARRSLPFDWGTQDCCVFPFDAVLAMTGVDMFAFYRGRYSTEAEANALIGAAGLDGAVLALMAGFGAPLILPSTAQRGDVALVVVGNMELLGLVVGDRVAVTGTDGLVFVKNATARRVWAI